MVDSIFKGKLKLGRNNKDKKAAQKDQDK